MKRSIPAATAVASLALAGTAQAHTANVTVAPRCDADGHLTVQIDHVGFPSSPSWVADQVNVDGNPARGKGLNDQGDALYRVSGSSRVGYILTPGAGQHTVTVFSKWNADGGGFYGPRDFPVDCGPLPVKTITVEKVVDHYIPVPVAPKVCRVTKTIVAHVGGRKGHQGPRFERLTIRRTDVPRSDSRSVVGRVVKRAETIRYRLTVPCGVVLRLDGSVRKGSKHRLVIRKAWIIDDGYSSVGVNFGRY